MKKNVEEHYMTRDEAVRALYRIVNSGILSDDVEDDLEEIAQCIEHEENNLFLWVAPKDEIVDLFIAVREDLITDAWEKHCNEIYDRYKIKPVN